MKLDQPQLDFYWQNLLLALIGETLDPSDLITGARVVDKGGKNTVMHRLEVWLKTNDQEKVQGVRERLDEALAEGAPKFPKGAPKFEWKKHGKN